MRGVVTWRPPRQRAHPEQDFQIEAATALGWLLPEPYWFTAIGHGGGGSERGQALKRMGLKPGVLDLLIRGPGLVGWIELKVGHKVASKEQLALMARFESYGDKTAVCYCLEEIIDTVRSWGVPLRDRKPDHVMDGLTRSLRELAE